MHDHGASPKPGFDLKKQNGSDMMLLSYLAFTSNSLRHRLRKIIFLRILARLKNSGVNL